MTIFPFYCSWAAQVLYFFLSLIGIEPSQTPNGQNAEYRNFIISTSTSIVHEPK